MNVLESTGFSYVDDFLSREDQSIESATKIFFMALAELGGTQERDGKCSSCAIKSKLTYKLLFGKQRKIKFLKYWKRHDNRTAELLFEGKVGDELVLGTHELSHPVTAFLLSLMKNKTIEEI